MKSKIIKSLIGIIILFINLIWISFFGNLYYEYHFTDILFYYMFPDWLLILNLFIGLIGILIGIKIIKYRIKILQALIIDIIILLIGLSLTWIIPMY
jgi:hypothetical protein